MPIELAKERVIVARLIMAIIYERGRRVFPDLSVAEAQELQLIATTVFIGHAEGRSLNASEIARQARMPRASVHRKLGTLIQRGLIVKRGRGYCVVLTVWNDPAILAMARGLMRRIKTAARELSKLDTYLINVGNVAFGLWYIDGVGL